MSETTNEEFVDVCPKCGADGKEYVTPRDGQNWRCPICQTIWLDDDEKSVMLVCQNCKCLSYPSDIENGLCWGCRGGAVVLPPAW